MLSLRDLLAEEIARPVHEAVSAMAEIISARHGAAVRAVLFYGSCLRDRVPGPGEDDLLDFYVLVDRYGDFYDTRLAAVANALLPPNVFFMETLWQGRTLRAKYAVISLAHFRHGASPRCIQPMIWARFCQPTRLVMLRDGADREDIITSLTDAVTTLLTAAGPGEQPWVRGFRETYRCELRPEGVGRAKKIYQADRERYDRIAALVDGGRRAVPWIVRRIVGKLLNGARLVKAVFNYDGALDYALWKIARHSSVHLTASDWQRRHPLLASPALIWRLFRLGAFR